MLVNLMAPINQLGYGVVGCNVLKFLQKAEHDVAYFPIGQPLWDTDVSFVKEAADRARTFSSQAPSIKIWHQNDMAMFPASNTRIGWPIFELNKFTDIERHHLMSVDRLFVCSKWAKDVLENEGIVVDKIDVVPLGVDSSVFFVNNGIINHRAYWTRPKTIFINAGKWEVRKGHNELVEAFSKAFTPKDNVELWMLNHNDFIGRENEMWKVKYLSSPMGASIRILPRAKTQRELCAIFNSVDFGVFPAHAEGWNLEPLELMACGVPSILTNYSGHTEYANSNNSLLLEPNGLEVAQDGRWFHGQGEWCTFEIDALVEQLRRAHEMKQSENPRGDYGRIAFECLETAKKFSWENTVKQIEVALS